MGKCADQVYFVEKWSKGQELKFLISWQYCNILFSVNLRIMDEWEPLRFWHTCLSFYYQNLLGVSC